MAIRGLAWALVAFCFVGSLNADETIHTYADDDPAYELTSLAGSSELAGLAECGKAVDCSPVCSGCCDCACGCSSFRIEGWLNGGFLLNADKPASGFHGPYNQTDRHGGELNQAYLILEQPLSDSPGWSLGGRVDLMFGTDFFLAQSKGLEKHPEGTSKWSGDEYGLAIPQAYGEIGGDRLSLKIGHFYTIVGYEGVPAVNNFFYTKSLSYMFAGPFVQWGGLTTWKANDRLSFDAGIVNGWDALDRVTDRATFLGRVSLGNEEDAIWTSFAIISGDERNNAGTESTNRTRYSLIAGSNITSRLQYVFHHWYGVQDDFLAAGNSAAWYGIDQYLYYELTPCMRLGGRFEWFRDDDGVRLGLSRPTNPNNGAYVGDMYSLSLGVNWEPYQNFMLRPEVRWDWFEGTGLPFADGTDDQQFLVGMDAIWRF